MKKSLHLSVLSCFLFLFSSAQFNPGQKMISGQLSFNSGKSTDNITPGNYQKNNTATLSFSFSKFRTPQRLLGFGVLYSYMNSTYNSAPFSSQNITNHVGSLFAEIIQLQPLAKKLFLSFNGTGGINYNRSKTNYSTGGGMKSSGYGVYVSGGMGLWYHLNNRFVLTGNISNLLNASYAFGKTENSASSGGSVVIGNAHNFSFSTGLNGFSLGNFSIGARYLLKK